MSMQNSQPLSSATASQGNSQPPIISPQPVRSRKRHRLRVPLIAFLLLLTGLVGVASFFAPRFFENTSGSGNVSGLTPGGAFVRPPLTPAQQVALMHLVGYMKYKQLASLYVSHMTLDEELGQLIMVEYADTYYSPDLDTMVNKLHAGE